MRCTNGSLPLLTAWLLLLMPSTRADMKFAVPPEGGLPGNYTGNADYIIGEMMNISWFGGIVGVRYHLVMFQDLNPDSEVIQRNVPSEGGLPWTVGTSKNIKGSGVFYFELQIQTDDDSMHAGPKCHYFNIVSASNTANSGSGNSGPGANASTTTTNRIAVPTTLTTKKPNLNAESMNINTKIGFGVGIPAAVLVGILMGWLLLRSRRRREISVQHKEAFEDEFRTDGDNYSKAELPVTYKRAIKPELPG